MVFSSGLFLIYFLPLVISGYFFIPKKLKNTYLLLFSLFFYWWGAPTFLWVILGICSANFFIAKKIALGIKKKSFLVLYVCLNLSLLIYFKYFNFFIDNFNTLLLQLGFSAVEWIEIALPLGISFFTFHSITYGIDVYRNDAKVQSNIVNYWLYILFFPQLIAGPIVTYKSIAHQLSKRETNIDNVLDGFVRFTIGLAKKVLIANVLSEYGQMLSAHELSFGEHSTLIAWLSALAYTFEIYFDFSGYSDMAIGLARMFGFKFPENFDRPYLSKSITEFWQRWHITLGNFMKNYLYVPLGGNRRGNRRTYVNLSTVFVLSGLWHGAAWNFVIWGAFHGFWLVAERIFFKNRYAFKIPWIHVVVTFFIVVNGWVFFKAGNLQEALNQLSNMYAFENFSYLNDRNLFYFEAHMVIAAIICCLGFSTRTNKIYTFSLSKIQNNGLKTGVFCFVGLFFFLSLAHVVTGSFNPFIYFKF